MQNLKFSGYLCDLDVGVFNLLCAPLAESIVRFFTAPLNKLDAAAAAAAEQPRFIFIAQAKPFFNSRFQFFQ